MKALLSPKGFVYLVSSISARRGGEGARKGNWQASAVLESAGGASLAVCSRAALPGSIPVVNRQGMLWGNCLGVEPNIRHNWQTVYSLRCIFSTKHGACPIFSTNWYIPQPGFWYKCELCGTGRSHTLTDRWNRLQFDSSFCAIHTIVRVVVTGSNYTSHIRACCLFEGKLWVTDGYLINKFPLDHSVFMLHASHSISVLQSLMGFSQLSCFPLMWPKMTCGPSGKMVSAPDDELAVYFKISVDSMANSSIKHQTSCCVSSFILFKISVLVLMKLWNSLTLADLADFKM